MTNSLSSKETLGKEPKENPTPQEELAGLLRKLADLSVDMRATCYKTEMLIRKCEDCLVNNKGVKK